MPITAAVGIPKTAAAEPTIVHTRPVSTLRHYESRARFATNFGEQVTEVPSVLPVVTFGEYLVTVSYQPANPAFSFAIWPPCSRRSVLT